MHDTLTVAAAGMAGLALGGLFFAGLWWTVRLGMTSRHPGLWFIVSLLLRMNMVLAGIWLIGHGNWQRLLACLLGIGLARATVIVLIRPLTQTPQQHTLRTSHAP
jgi:F1F0 ATPase subunit 2